MIFSGISKHIADLKAFERGCLSWAFKLLQFFKFFGTTCRSYESLSKLGALTVCNLLKERRRSVHTVHIGVQMKHWGGILGGNPDRSLKSFPPCYSQTPLLTNCTPSSFSFLGLEISTALPWDFYSNSWGVGACLG